MRRLCQTLLILTVTTLLVSGCGFKMRGTDLGLPFNTIVVRGNFSVGEEIRETIHRQSKVQFPEKSTDAEVILTILDQKIEREITAFDAAGRPREMQLRLRVKYRVTDRYAIELSSIQEIFQMRDLTVNDAEILSAPRAEKLALENMQTDIAQQILRRLRAVKLPQ